MSGSISRVILVVLDGVGAGELPDAAAYGDEGSNTLANTARAAGGLRLPNMGSLGLGRVTPILGVPPLPAPTGCYGKMAEASPGKDTITGHWEIAGAILSRPFPVYPNGFPRRVIEAFERRIAAHTLCNLPASGTEVIARLGRESVLAAAPIVYTSADSVFQVAMHEEVFPIERQLDICRIARAMLTGRNRVGRVICRPFVGDGDDPEVRRALGKRSSDAVKGPFRRTERRMDFPVEAPPTVLDELVAAGMHVHAIGKIREIFNGRGISSFEHTTNNGDHIAALQTAVEANESHLIFANLEDFDMLYGHRNDALGMAAALEAWDAALGSLLPALRKGDLLLITSDHGNDPTTPSTDHSREHPFLLAYGPDLNGGVDLGIRSTFADVAATVRQAFGMRRRGRGVGFLSDMLGAA